MDLLDGLATTRAIRRYGPGPIPDGDLASILWHATTPRRARTTSPPATWSCATARRQRRPRPSTAKGPRARAPRGSARPTATTRGTGSDPDSPKRMARAMQAYVDEFESIPVVVLACALPGASARPAGRRVRSTRRAEPAAGGPGAGLRRDDDDVVPARRGRAAGAARHPPRGAAGGHDHPGRARQPARAGAAPAAGDVIYDARLGGPGALGRRPSRHAHGRLRRPPGRPRSRVQPRVRGER